MSGCSKAVLIPRENIQREEYREPGSYRIRLKGWNEYYARRFSVTDSTIVIEELLKSDDRYKLMKHDMPIVVPLDHVEYVGVMKTVVPATTVLLLAGAATLVYFGWLMIALAGSGLGS
ncbi:MAG TPA: hypothetical protein VF128_01310 [Gemmatimonadaceae bacterium]